jgi:hypothetical protein
MIRQRDLVIVLTVLALATALAARAGDEETGTHKVTGSITVAPGEHTGDLATVNGSIKVGDNAIVGSAHTVNGSIKLGSHASAQQLATVNGSVHLNDGARVTERVHTVNGSMTLENGADVGGRLDNVNGSIRVSDSHVGGEVGTVTGSMELGPNARVDGGILVHRDSGSSHSERPQLIVIGPGSVVQGALRFERPVELYVSDRATIGTVEGATPIKFSGDHPPGVSSDE